MLTSGGTTSWLGSFCWGFMIMSSGLFLPHLRHVTIVGFLWIRTWSRQLTSEEPVRLQSGSVGRGEKEETGGGVGGWGWSWTPTLKNNGLVHYKDGIDPPPPSPPPPPHQSSLFWNHVDRLFLRCAKLQCVDIVLSISECLTHKSATRI